ncbi:MAG: hypothetical protein WDW38_005877 [Sanguina aurantia]
MFRWFPSSSRLPPPTPAQGTSASAAPAQPAPVPSPPLKALHQARKTAGGATSSSWDEDDSDDPTSDGPLHTPVSYHGDKSPRTPFAWYYAY